MYYSNNFFSRLYVFRFTIVHLVSEPYDVINVYNFKIPTHYERREK